ncbi:unnamed protein product [Staurois parvus]|uniref:Uncharacterized protein n=1 Tax=Staurois parvus TaxID=386267 RepID=A0ABN9FFK5_9NEOB|nr:unnamed protein product [Staurois parvus]
MRISHGRCTCHLVLPISRTAALYSWNGDNSQAQGQTDNSWGPWAIGDHGAPVCLPTLKAHSKKPIKGTSGISWGPLLTPGPQAVP